MRIENMGPVDADLFWRNTFSGVGGGERKLWAALLQDAFEEIGIIRSDTQRIITLDDYIDTVWWLNEKSWAIGGSYFVFETVFNNIPPDEIFKFISNYRCRCCGYLVMMRPCRSAIPVRSRVRSGLRQKEEDRPRLIRSLRRKKR
jgi:hypothetical protein